MKADRTVLKETGRTAAFTFILTLAMHTVFLIVSRWDLAVLWGSLLGLAGAVADFFLLGLSVQKAVSSDEKTAKNIIRISQQGRLMMLAVILVIAFAVPAFNKLAAILPLFFQKIGVRLRALFDPEIRKPGSGNKGTSLPDIETIENGGDAP